MTFGARIRIAREIAGATQQEFAVKANITQAAIAQIENSQVSPRESTFDALTFRLPFTPAFFERPPLPPLDDGSLRWRARRSMTAIERARVLALSEVVLEIYEELALSVARFPVRLPSTNGTPEEAARQLRREWGIPVHGPIQHVLHHIEKAGIVALSIPTTSETQDAFSTWWGGPTRLPIVVLVAGKPGDRTRWSTSHEIAHLLLHSEFRGTQSKIVEKEADRFAAEFLLPHESFAGDVETPVTLESLAKLKRKWGVSLQALILRAKDVKHLTSAQASKLIAQLHRKGWWKREPAVLDIATERPRALLKMAELATNNSLDLRALSSKLGIKPGFLTEVFSLYESR